MYLYQYLYHNDNCNKKSKRNSQIKHFFLYILNWHDYKYTHIFLDLIFFSITYFLEGSHSCDNLQILFSRTWNVMKMYEILKIEYEF